MIRNTGEGPLELLLGPKTCRCTAIKVLDRVVPSGGEGRVEIEWTTTDPNDEYRQGASV